MNIIPGRLTNLREFVYVSIVVIPNDHWSSGLVLVFASKFILSVVNAIMINNGDRIDHNYKFLYILTLELAVDSLFGAAAILVLFLMFMIKATKVYSIMEPNTNIRQNSRYQSIAFT